VIPNVVLVAISNVVRIAMPKGLHKIINYTQPDGIDSKHNRHFGTTREPFEKGYGPVRGTVVGNRDNVRKHVLLTNAFQLLLDKFNSIK
jgi:hypothetical protein